MNKHVVISKYHNDDVWVKKLNVPYTIIDKSQTKNLGSEAWAYLRYIVDNYDNLPDRMLFVHGHENSHHQDYPTWYIAKHLDWNLEYMNINTRKFEEQYISSFDDFEDIERNYRKSYELWIKTPWNEVFGNFPRPHTLTFLGHAQFVVCRDLVKRHDIKFYKNIINWLETTKIDEDLYTGIKEKFNKSEAYVSGRILEYTWHYIFTGNPEEQLNKYML